MKDSYGTYDGRKPEPAYATVEEERDALIARLRTAEERIEKLRHYIQSRQTVVTLPNGKTVPTNEAGRVLAADAALASRPHDDGTETK